MKTKHILKGLKRMQRDFTLLGQRLGFECASPPVDGATDLLSGTCDCKKGHKRFRLEGNPGRLPLLYREIRRKNYRQRAKRNRHSFREV